jgi:hypothetical protein
VKYRVANNQYEPCCTNPIGSGSDYIEDAAAGVSPLRDYIVDRKNTTFKYVVVGIVAVVVVVVVVVVCVTSKSTPATTQSDNFWSKPRFSSRQLCAKHDAALPLARCVRTLHTSDCLGIGAG